MAFDVLVHDRPLFKMRTGVGQYLAALAAHWPAAADARLTGFHAKTFRRNRPLAERFHFPHQESLQPVRLNHLKDLRAPRRARRRWLRAPAQHLYEALMAREYRRGGYSLFFEPNNLPPIDGGAVVSAMMDLSALETPNFHAAEHVEHWRRRLESAVRRTTHWIAISRTTAAAMTRRLGILQKSITVIPLAPRWGEPPDDWRAEELRRRLGLPSRYFACVGTIEPRKNIGRLLDAYAVLPAEQRRRTPLVLVGSPGWGDASFWRSLAEHPMAEHVWTTGYVGDAECAAILYASRGLLYPSFYEGFGLPPLEAMTLGVPTAVSTAESLREVCCEAAALVDPDDTEAWADAILTLDENPDHRSALINAGLHRAKAFSWESTAARHADLFQRLAGRRRGAA